MPCFVFIADLLQPDRLIVDSILPVAAVLDEPYIQLTPLRGVAV
jgi:hypothetical protein